MGIEAGDFFAALVCGLWHTGTGPRSRLVLRQRE
jgi:hypothetical protein